MFQYSGGVAALPGFRIRRVRFARPVPLADGFQRIEKILQAAGRPLTAFCQCELRSPAPFTEDGFRAFNEIYAGTLYALVDLRRQDQSGGAQQRMPRGRSAGDAVISCILLHRSAADAAPSFVVAGSGEAPEGHANYRDHIVRLGDTSADGLREKARFVLDEMARRMGALGFTWRDTTATQVYTVHDLHPFLADEIVKRGAAHSGLTWQYCRPPVVGLDYEMDCRGLAFEQVADA